MSTEARRAVARLQELCRIPTVTSDRDRVGEGADWLLRTYAAGCDFADVYRDDGGSVAGLLLCFAGRDRDRVTFFNYLDVTPPGAGSAWTVDPFSAEVRDGRIYARGAASNKGDLIARLEAVAELRARGGLRRDVVFWIDAAEEHGSPRLAEMLDRWRDRLAADLVVWNTGFVNAAGTPVVGCGFKGVVIAELSVDVDALAGHSGLGAGTSAIHRLLALVDPLLAEGGLDELLGPAPSAWDPGELLGPAPSAWDPGDALRLAVASGIAATGESSDRLVQRRLLESTCNVPWFEGGRPDALTRYAGAARCAVELRLVPPQPATAALAALAARCADADVDCSARMSIEPYTLEPDARAAVLDAVSEPLATAFGRPPVVLPVVPFSARAQEVADALGAAIVSIGLTDSRSAPHAPDESISEDLFLRTIGFVRRLVG